MTTKVKDLYMYLCDNSACPMTNKVKDLYMYFNKFLFPRLMKIPFTPMYWKKLNTFVRTKMKLHASKPFQHYSMIILLYKTYYLS